VCALVFSQRIQQLKRLATLPAQEPIPGHGAILLVFRSYGMKKAEVMPNAGFSTAIEEI